MLTKEFMLFADTFQFWIQDGETDDVLPVHWEPEDEDNMALVANRVIAVRTARELDVPISLEVMDAPPRDDEPLEDWDHVVQCTLDVESGKLLITATSEDLYSAQNVLVTPGLYGLRIYFGALDQIDSEGFEGDDYYKVKVWYVGQEDEVPPFEIMKQWLPPR